MKRGVIDLRLLADINKTDRRIVFIPSSTTNTVYHRKKNTIDQKMNTELQVSTERIIKENATGKSQKEQRFERTPFIK